MGWGALRVLYLVRESREDLWDSDEERHSRPEKLERCIHAGSCRQERGCLLESSERRPVDMAAEEWMPLFGRKEANRGELP